MFFHLCSNPRRGEWIGWMKDWKPQRLTRISYKQYIMKAASLLEHKGVFQVFVFYRTPIFSSFPCSILISASPLLCVLKTKLSTHCHNFLDNFSSARGISCKFMLKFPFFQEKLKIFRNCPIKQDSFRLPLPSNIKS